MEWDAGQRMGSYELRRPLGRGAMGQVWSAILHGSHGFRRLVALKILDAVHGEGPEALLREARLGGLVHHPNVVSALEVGEANGHWFVVMDLVRGVTASKLRGRVGPAALVDFAVQACAGLRHLHELTGLDGEPLGLVHRDVKPANLMVDAAGTVRVLDFGIARLGGLPGEPAGTIGYMAPEQLDGEGCPASDVFSLALVLVHLATGLRPLAGSAAKLARVERYLSDPALHVALDDAVPGLASVVRTAVRQRPEERYPSARAFASALQLLRVPSGTPLARAVAPHLPEDPVIDLEVDVEAPPAAQIVGRERARAAVAERVKPGAVVIVTGPAGVGKSALVDAVVDTLPLPVLRCELGAVRVGEDLLAALAGVLELRGVLDVSRLADALEARGEVVLVLDSVDHVAEELGALLDDLLPLAPDARVLCASRVSIPAVGGVEAKLGPLAAPAARSLLRRLCPRRLRATEIAAILKEVGRLPLAIELAAAAVCADGLAPFLASLRDGGIQQLDALEQSIRVSWDLLPPSARDDLARLATFVGPFDLQAAAAVLPVEGSPVRRLEHLVRCSMLQVRGQRFRLLPSLRAFVRRHGRRVAQDAGHRGHGRWFARLGAEALVSDRGISIEHALQLRASLDELLVAQKRAIARRDHRVAVDCVMAAAQPLMAAGRPQKVADLVDSVWRTGLRRPELRMRRALALTFLGRAAEAEEDLRDAHVRCHDPVTSGRYARFRSVSLRVLGRPRDAVEVLERSWPAQELAGDPRYADTVGELGRCLLAAGRPWEADTYLARALDGSRRDIGRCVYGSSRSLVHLFMGCFDDAVDGLLAALADQEALGLLTTSLGSRGALAVSYWLSGRPAAALAAAEQLIEDADRVGFAEDAVAGRVLQAHVMVELGDAGGAEACALAAFEALPSREHRRACEVWMTRAAVCWALGRRDDARAFALEAPEVPDTLGWEWTLADQALELARYGLHDACEAKLARLEDGHNPWRYSVTTAHLARAEVARARGEDPSFWLQPCDEGLRGMQWGSQEAPLLRVRRSFASP